MALDDNDLYGALQSGRELLTEAGEYSTADTIAKVDENAAGKRGIPYYQKALDSLAVQLQAPLTQPTRDSCGMKRANTSTRMENR